MPVLPPSNFTEIISETEISTKITEIASGINEWITSLKLESNKDIVAMPIMRGAIYFFSDLSRELSHSIEIVPARTWGYVVNQENEKAIEMKIDLAGFDPKGKTILLVDEICDSGRTLKLLSEKLLDKGAKIIRSTTLVHRMVPDLIFSPDWVGFELEANDWLVGYGMDDSDRFRNLKSIYKKL